LNLNNKKAKVLFDYEATDSSEISVFANQVRFLIKIPTNAEKFNIIVLNKDNQYTNIAK
jgi:hypothetical protein